MSFTGSESRICVQWELFTYKLHAPGPEGWNIFLSLNWFTDTFIRLSRVFSAETNFLAENSRFSLKFHQRVLNMPPLLSVLVHMKDSVGYMHYFDGMILRKNFCFECRGQNFPGVTTFNNTFPGRLVLCKLKPPWSGHIKWIIPFRFENCRHLTLGNMPVNNVKYFVL